MYLLGSWEQGAEPVQLCSGTGGNIVRLLGVTEPKDRDAAGNPGMVDTRDRNVWGAQAVSALLSLLFLSICFIPIL